MMTKFGQKNDRSAHFAAAILGMAWLAVALCGCVETPQQQTRVAASSVTDTPCVAHLTVETSPSGAEITINNQPLGSSPVKTELAPGTYAVHAELDGCAPQDATVDLSCHPHQMTLSLADNAPPTLTLADPPQVIIQGDPLDVIAHAQDVSGIDRIELWLDETLIHQEPGDSLDRALATDELFDGQHVIRVVAHDTTGHSHGEERVFMVIHPTVTAPPPTIPPPTRTPAPPTATAEPTPSPTTVRSQAQPIQPVQVYWAEIMVPTYRYEQALYVDESAGHPYPLLHRDQVGGPEPRTYQVIVVRNEFLELTLLPELGGRIYQCRYLPTNQPLLYNNKVIKHTHWGPEDQGWWLAVGGIEFCLPVDEHGYLTAEPWEATVDQRADGSANVTMSIFERTREIDAQVTISLAPGESRFDIASRLTNTSRQTQSLQYWINAILAPGADSIGPDLRFYYPTEQMIMHSTGDDWLPGAGTTIGWPIHDGRDLASYATWRNWLGVFAQEVDANYSAVYDHATQIGVVRVFPYETARGVKLFGFGQGFGDSAAYTDDGSQYIEMWGGWTPAFWDYGDLGAGQTLAWRETWYPLAGTDGVTMATEDLAVQLRRAGNRVVGAISATRAGQWRLDVLAGDQVIAQATLSLTPGAAQKVDLFVGAGNHSATWSVRIVDENGDITLTQALGGQE